VRRAILGTGIGLDLHDPADAAAAVALAHEQNPEQAARRLVHRAGEKAAQVVGGRQEYLSASSDGTIQPKRVKKSGMSEERKSSTTWDPL
jgi:hypothetical protein